MTKIEELAALLARIGCPKDKSAEMAMQLDKRAQQLAVEKNRTYDEAMAYLLGMMRMGWAAKEQESVKDKKPVPIAPGMVPNADGGAAGPASSHAP